MNNVAAAVASFARQDLAAARRHGLALIGQTTRGTVAVRYDAVAKTYTLTTQGLDSKELARGKATAVVPVLAALYVVEVES